MIKFIKNLFKKKKPSYIIDYENNNHNTNSYQDWIEMELELSKRLSKIKK